MPSEVRIPRGAGRTLFFPNLNGLRFIAALLVIVHHTEQVKSDLHYANYWSNAGIQVIGKLGVVLFFVLSGFLITYLLLEEERLTGGISISSFYARRILRIWPLYYVVVLLSFLALPRIGLLNIGSAPSDSPEHLVIKAGLFVLILPNLAMAIFRVVPHLSQAWSVGTEEQFYVVWPWLLRRVKDRRVFLFIAIIVGYLLVRTALDSLIASHPTEQGFAVAGRFWYYFDIDCMAIGALTGYAAFHRMQPFMAVFTHRIVEIGAIVVAIVCMGIGFVFPYYHYGFYATLFAIIILNAAVNPRTVVRLENPLFRYLGKISFGLYMYHVVAVVSVVKVAHNLRLESFPGELMAIVALTAVIAGVSYRFIETPFLKLKPKFSKIISGDAARRHERSLNLTGPE